MQLDDLDLRYAHGLWLGAVSSRFGLVEVLFGGSVNQPDEQDIAAFRRFSVALDENIAKLRKQIGCSFLYRPIRIAVNNEKRVGVQFQNRITGSQSTLILEGQPTNP
jgi:hypothetical protein